MSEKHCLGYKICYCEKHNMRFKRHFKAFTLKQAQDALQSYIRYPPVERNTNRVLVKPKWKIIPISRKEIRAGIWREDPF